MQRIRQILCGISLLIFGNYICAYSVEEITKDFKAIIRVLDEAFAEELIYINRLNNYSIDLADSCFSDNPHVTKKVTLVVKKLTIRERKLLILILQAIRDLTALAPQDIITTSLVVNSPLLLHDFYVACEEHCPFLYNTADLLIAKKYEQADLKNVVFNATKRGLCVVRRWAPILEPVCTVILNAEKKGIAVHLEDIRERLDALLGRLCTVCPEYDLTYIIEEANEEFELVHNLITNLLIKINAKNE